MMTERKKPISIARARALLTEALKIDGEHHKQWYLEEVFKALGGDPTKVDHWEGIPP